MRSRRKCRDCGTVLSEDAPELFCPKCMFEGALHLNDVPSDSSNLKEITLALPRIGKYQLLQEVARGGMGVVYKASQIGLNRIVAVKLILIGQFADKIAVQRFKAEALAASKLRHPNIVAIHEIGEDGGQHFFSMEYIEGSNLAEFMQQQPVSISAAAQLIATIAKAVNYAHGDKIIHRDLKPSNILIDSMGEPHITDFGLARDMRSNSELTLTGQVLGSPSYISPEQASGKMVETPSDVYSIGAILYHLLAGRPPFVAETLTGTLEQVMSTEPVSPRILNPDVPRDLETICLECLEKQPEKRCSAAGLAEELHRFLNGEPILSRPISRSARAWRWCRRKPVVAALSVGFGISLVAGIVGVTWQFYEKSKAYQRAVEAERQQARLREHAEIEAVKSRQVADFLKKMLAGVGPSVALGRDTKLLREILDKTAENINKDLHEHPEATLELRQTLASTYYDLALYREAEQIARANVQLARSLFGNEHRMVAAALALTGMAQSRIGQRQEAEANLQEALGLQRKLLGNETPEVVKTLRHLGHNFWWQGKDERAEAIGREGLAIAERVFGRDSFEVVALLRNVGLAMRRSKSTQAVAMQKEALAISRKIFGNEHPEVAWSLTDLGLTLQSNRELEAAEAALVQAVSMRRKMLGNDHSNVADSIFCLANVLFAQGKMEEAESMHREALGIKRRILGNDNPDVADSLQALAAVLRAQGRSQEARDAASEARAISETVRKMRGPEGK